MAALMLATTVWAGTAPSQQPADPSSGALALESAERIRITERSNLSTRENGRYLGLLNRQGTGYLTRTEAAEFTGRFFVFEQLRRDRSQVARPVDHSFESTLAISPDALLAGDGEYPSLQHLSIAPSGAQTRALRPGARWEAPAWTVITPRPGASSLRLPVIVAYHYRGEEIWNGAPAVRIEAQFATRYPVPPSDDPDAPVVRYQGPLVEVRGAHRLTMLLPVEVTSEAQVAFLRDEVEEHYRFSDGTTRSVQGHVLLFLAGLTVERQRIVEDQIEEQLREAEIEDITVETTDTGVRLTIDALRFLPDQAVLLPEERGRLDQVARALARTEGTRFLIVGHTADVGSQRSQEVLSVERARVIAAELSERGISPDRMDIEGRGGTDPVASNATEEGRARNRRVEIYVLEE
ncbi:MAG: OmpA family protein [Spirochaetota bacterium]